LLAIEHRLTRWRIGPLSIQCHLEPFGHQTPANVLYGLGAATEGFGDSLVRPGGTIRIRLLQNLCSPHFL
jgi:hypothetical protein